MKNLKKHLTQGNSYPRFTADQMSFIQDKQMYILHVFSLFPSSGQHIPLFWSANYHVTLKK